MRISMSMYDELEKRDVFISQDELEFLDDIAELMFTFLKACGYTYVTAVGVDKGNNETVWTVR